MSFALVLLPDFTLILIGAVLRRWVRFDEGFWAGLEKLVYFVLFPALLFHSTATARFDRTQTGAFVAAGCSITLLGFVLGYAARLVYRDGDATFASGVQTAFRFNSYLALAVAGRIGGNSGIALMALLLGTNVPLSNVLAVYSLARHGRIGLWGAMLRNPLILATLGGLVCNAAGITLPEFIDATLMRLGAASIALGLIAVGAGLRAEGANAPKPLIAWWLLVKLALLPGLGLMLAAKIGFEDLARETLVVFAALPTASSAYILATRMGGNGPLVAFLISAGTLVSVLTLPFWLWLSR